MKKKAGFLALMLMMATNAWAVSDVSKTWHNLSTSAVQFAYQSAIEDEVCIYCHTPHGGKLDAPLWNRDLPVGAFTHYSSATISTTLGSTTRAVNAESLVCMSCHDGSTALNNIINQSASTGGIPDQVDPMPAPMVGFGVGSVIGTYAIDGVAQNATDTRNLTDDHPISFSYYDVYNDTTGGENYTTQFKTIALAEAAGIRFFPTGGGAVAGGKRVECSSCHDPHVNYTADGGDVNLAPFLVRSNAGSGLCLACHIK